MGSSRLPGKVLLPLCGRPMLWHVVQRVRSAPGVTDVVVATTADPRDDAIREMCHVNGIAVFSGSEDDVLDRYHGAATAAGADPILRVTSDCPMVDPAVVGRLLRLYAEGAYDYAGVSIGSGARARGINGYPHGLDAECFGFCVLERAWTEAREQAEREHVTPYIWRRDDVFSVGILVPDVDWTHLRLTVDEPEDFALAEELYAALYQEGAPPFAFEDVVDVLEHRPELVALNRSFIGREKFQQHGQVREEGA